ncbi:hypothetical protein Bca4012_095761 [Brassica carinata]
MSGRSQHHNRYAMTTSLEPSCRYTSRIKHHEPQHTPAARTRHAFELIEHSKALMARDRGGFPRHQGEDHRSALHAPHRSNPKPTTPNRDIAISRHDSTTHETTRALDPLADQDRARSFPRSTDNNKAERVSETLVLQRRNREDKGKEGSSGVELDAHAPFNHRRDSRSENFGERDKFVGIECQMQGGMPSTRKLLATNNSRAPHFKLFILTVLSAPWVAFI